MRRAAATLWLVPIVLAAVFSFWPPRGEDSYHHSINAVEQVRAWREGAPFPRYHRAWNGGTGAFVPTIYSPIPLSIQGSLAWMTGDGLRAVGLSLALALVVSGAALVRLSGRLSAILVLIVPYIVSLSLSRSTTTEAWSMAGAAIVLPLALPPASWTKNRCLFLALGVLLVAGCQVGALLQLGWLLAAAWVVSVLASAKDSRDAVLANARRLARVLIWASAGLLTGAVLWLPAVVDAKHFALPELVAGSYDWRQNFLPATSGMGLFLTVTAGSLVVIALVVAIHGRGAERFAYAAAIAAGAFFSTPLSAPLWHLPKMEILQFPWRFLGPATLVATLAVAGLRGRPKIAAMVVLLAPLAFVPINIGSGDDRVPTASSPEELALIGQRQWNEPTLQTTGGLYAPDFHRLESLQRLDRQRPRVEVLQRDVHGGSWRVDLDESSLVLLPLQWWPEWRIEADGEEIAYDNRWGLVAVRAEAEDVVVGASLQPSRSRSIGWILSLIGAVVLGTLYRAWGRDRTPAGNGTSHV